MTEEAFTEAASADLTAFIVDRLKDKYEAPEDTEADSVFDDLGIDSLVLAELAVDLTGVTGVRIEESDLSDAGTPSAAAKALHAKGARVPAA
jgi:acyl carrier protein